MAQTTKWLHAIRNYMRKVNTIISTVFGQLSCSNTQTQLALTLQGKYWRY